MHRPVLHEGGIGKKMIMKNLLTLLVVISLFVEAFSITCYRCGGAAVIATSCESSGLETVECTDSSTVNAVFACQVYTVNYTRLRRVLQFKSCCLYEDCDKNPCEQFGQGTVCSRMASCQSDKCNKDYDTAKASQRPTLPAKACKVLFDCLVIALAAVACYFFV
ncbi:uncharacterized protein [Montipora foliosa]|uniref:uncharacterized protein n=1 Tax=Montipora foliosa TaxID=591990 RepID=UPI0035F16FA8